MLIDGLLLVSVSKSIVNNTLVGTPNILHQFSQSLTPFPGNIPSFCFPDATYLLKSSAKPISAKHVFVLTDSRGDKQYGYCRRFYANNSFISTPLCLCIMTSQDYKWFSFFEEILRILRNIVFPENGENLDESTVESLFKKAVTLVKEIISQGERNSNTQFLEIPTHNISFPLPSTSPKKYPIPDFSPLLKTIEKANRFLHIFVCLLLERRIIFCSNNLQRLTECIFSALQLIHPFEWQYIFVPVLPQSLLGYCTAPMPFILGIHASCIPELKRLPMDEYLFVNLDTGALRAAPSIVSEVNSVPSKLALRIKELDYTFNASGTMSLQETIARTFREFFFALIGDYQNYFQLDANARIIFDVEAFLNNQPKDTRPFCEMFVDSQLFHVFIQQTIHRMEHNRPNESAFERDCASFAQVNPNKGGFVEQLFSFGTKYANKMSGKKEEGAVVRPPIASHNNKAAPELVPIQNKSNNSSNDSISNSQSTDEPLLDDPLPPPVKLHECNEQWDKTPEEIGFTVLHQVFSPSFNKEKGELRHTVVPYVKPEPPVPIFLQQPTSLAINTNNLNMNTINANLTNLNTNLNTFMQTQQQKLGTLFDVNVAQAQAQLANFFQPNTMNTNNQPQSQPQSIGGPASAPSTVSRTLSDQPSLLDTPNLDPVNHILPAIQPLGTSGGQILQPMTAQVAPPSNNLSVSASSPNLSHHFRGPTSSNPTSSSIRSAGPTFIGNVPSSNDVPLSTSPLLNSPILSSNKYHHSLTASPPVPHYSYSGSSGTLRTPITSLPFEKKATPNYSALSNLAGTGNLSSFLQQPNQSMQQLSERFRALAMEGKASFNRSS